MKNNRINNNNNERSSIRAAIQERQRRKLPKAIPEHIPLVKNGTQQQKPSAVENGFMAQSSSSSSSSSSSDDGNYDDHEPETPSPIAMVEKPAAPKIVKTVDHKPSVRFDAKSKLQGSRNRRRKEEYDDDDVKTIETGILRSPMSVIKDAQGRFKLVDENEVSQPTSATVVTQQKASIHKQETVKNESRELTNGKQIATEQKPVVVTGKQGERGAAGAKGEQGERGTDGIDWICSEPVLTSQLLTNNNNIQFTNAEKLLCCAVGEFHQIDLQFAWYTHSVDPSVSLTATARLRSKANSGVFVCTLLVYPPAQPNPPSGTCFDVFETNGGNRLSGSCFELDKQTQMDDEVTVPVIIPLVCKFILIPTLHNDKIHIVLRVTEWEGTTTTTTTTAADRAVHCRYHITSFPLIPFVSSHSVTKHVATTVVIPE